MVSMVATYIRPEVVHVSQFLFVGLTSMKLFRSFLRTIRPSHRTKLKIDFISELPLEISQLILRKLDPESLLRAAQVSRYWLRVCRSDPRLKITARKYKNVRSGSIRGNKNDFVELQATSITLSQMHDMRYSMRNMVNFYNFFEYCNNATMNMSVYKINGLWRFHL